MPGEIMNDINDVHVADGTAPAPLHPPVSSVDLCWCGNEPMHPKAPSCRESAGADLAERAPLCVCRCAVPTILYDGRQWCDRCVPRQRSGVAVGIHSVPICDDMAAIRELVPVLTKAVNRLCAILEAIATHGGKLTIEPLAPAARPAAGAPAGSRVKLGGRRGVVRSSGIAGMAIQWDDGVYDVLTSSMTRGIVLE